MIEQVGEQVKAGESRCLIPPRNGEGDHGAKRRGGGGSPQAMRLLAAPSTMLRMVPLPVPGRSFDVANNEKDRGSTMPAIRKI